ncbi:hypothetical protein GGF46_001728 [Coemansia sp. RSA 552]|nr:hypothetical protein GGF46_001728 [Coemansia sp. RSA 552]
MQIFATLLVAASAVIAQQVGSEQGPNVSGGPTAVSNPNVNNGEQFQNSLVASGNKGGNLFEGLTGNTFNDVTSNTGISDNNFINPSDTRVSGNVGPTANGADNHIGDVLASVPGVGGHGFGVPGFFKRDVQFNNGAYGYGHAGYPHGSYAPVYTHPAYVQPAPVYVHPAPAPVYAHPAAAPAYAPRPAYPAHPGASVNHNVQDASIIQNQA